MRMPPVSPPSAEIRRRPRWPGAIRVGIAGHAGAFALGCLLGCGPPAEVVVTLTGGDALVTAADPDGIDPAACSSVPSQTTCDAGSDVSRLEVCIIPGAGFDSYDADCSCGPAESLDCSAPNACSIVVGEGEQATCKVLFCAPTSLRTLSITLSSGQGKVEGTPGAISLRSASEMDSIEFCDGQEVSLTRTPAVGWLARPWSGDADCADSLTLTKNLSCSAEFYQPTLSVEVTGAGTVTSGSIACREGSLPADCERVVAAKLNVSLDATPDPGAVFLGWGGNCASSGTMTSALVPQIAANTHCTAMFSTVAVGSGGSGVIEVISVADDESFGDQDSGTSFGEIGHGYVGSADLSRVSFHSGATNLGGGAVAQGTAEPYYLRDRAAGTTTFLSQTANSTELGNLLSMSADGRFAAFAKAENYGDTQVWLLDLSDPTATAQQISLYDDVADVGREFMNGGGMEPAISANGRHVAYLTGSNLGQPIVADYDSCFGAPPLEGCMPHLVQISDPALRFASLGAPPRISADGRYIYFLGNELPSGPSTVYRHDRDVDDDGIFDEPGETATVIETPDPNGGSLDWFGAPFSIDASGRYLAFVSNDADLPGGFPNFGNAAFYRDTCAGAGAGCTPGYGRLTVRQDGSPGEDSANSVPMLSATARYAAFTTTDSWLVGLDPNDPDTFVGTIGIVRDTCIGVTSCTPANHEVTLRSDGVRTNSNPTYDSPIVSADGGLGAFVGLRADFYPTASFVRDVLLTVTGFVPEVGGKPTILVRTPASVPMGSAPFYLTIKGEGFVPGAQGWVGPEGQLEPRATVFVSRQHLQMLLEENDLADAGVLMLEVKNPGGNPSDLVSFVVN